MIDVPATYGAWIAKNTVVRQENGVLLIDTPFLNKHNDCLQIVCIEEQGRLRFTDDGYAVVERSLFGERDDELSVQQTLNALDVSMDEGER